MKVLIYQLIQKDMSSKINYLIVSLFLTSLTLADIALAESIAKLFSAQGVVEIKNPNAATWSKLSEGSAINSGDTVRTLSEGKAAILFTDGGLVRLSENSSMTFEPTKAASNIEKNVAMDSGSAFFFSREPKRFPNVITPSVSAAVRGTEFAVEVTSSQTKVSVLDGAVECKNSYGQVTLSQNEVATTKKGSAPQKSLLINPIDAVQWAINIPIIADKPSLAELRKTSTGGEIIEVSKLLSKGKLKDAESHLRKLHQSVKQKSTSFNGQSLSYIYAYDAILHLVRNDKAKARELSTLAISSNSLNTTALLSAAYVDQASFNLPGAKSKIEKLLLINPSNPVARAKLAELNLSLGSIDEAKRVINENNNSQLSNDLTHSVLGFIALIEYEPAKAIIEFNRAIELNPNSALPVLGRGLAKINQGFLQDGREDIEVAAALEPNVAIYRSYLGKAFFEEDRENLSLNEYARAIALDPNDPTPHLYRAYTYLSQNNVIGALSDVEDSISKNDNRAVYRSKLYLDEDSAVRSAGLAEVFNSIGFVKAAQIEAIKSINKDYGNYSAHKLLSESYNTIQTSDALLSEKAITNLLSPLSFNLYSNPGSDASLNEYNALFERPNRKVDLRYRGSTHEDLSVPAAFLTGRTEKFGYLLGVESGNANGSKDNNYLRDQRLRAAGQYQLTSKDRIITEGRYQAFHSVQDNSGLDEVISENYELDLGYHHKFGPGSGFISQVTYRDARNHFGSYAERPMALDIISDAEIFSTEEIVALNELANEDVRDLRFSAQYYKNTEFLTIVTGAESYSAKPKRRESSTILDDEFDLFPGIDRQLRSESTPDLTSQDIYLYPTLHLTKMLDLNLGVSYTNIEVEDRVVLPYLDTTTDQSRWNPKVGTTVYLTPDLTWRSAYFEGLRKSALEDTGTLEPTLVGGFNQIFNDFSGARSRTYATGLDYKIAKKTYMGVERSHRDVIEADNLARTTYSLDFDSLTQSTTTTLDDKFEDHFNQDFLSGYLYQVFSKRWVGTVDYDWFKSELTDPDVYQDLKLHRSRFTLRYFDPSGWFSFATATWREQNRDGSFFVEDGNSQFWIVDTGVGYRFPSRKGSIVFKCNNIFDKQFDYDQSPGFEEFVAADIAGEVLLSFNF